MSPIKGVNLSVKEAVELNRVGDSEMLDRMVEKARQEEVFSREDTPTERRIGAAFLYHTGLSYRRVKRMVGRPYEAVCQIGWFGPVKPLKW